MRITYRYRLYPTNYQKGLFAKFFGCARKAYNLLLEIDFGLYEIYLNEKEKLKEEKKLEMIEEIKQKKLLAGEVVPEDEEIEIDDKDIKIDYSKITAPKHLADNEYMPRLKQLKDMDEYSYLKEADANSLQRATKNEHEAFVAYVYGGNGKPKYRSKKTDQSYTTAFVTDNIKIDAGGNKIKVPKIGYVKMKYHRPISGVMKTITITKIRSTKEYYVCITCDVDIKAVKLPPVNHEIGIDLGIRFFYTTSDEEKVYALGLIDKYERKIKKLQRRLSREGIKVYKKDKDGNDVIAYVIPTKNYKKLKKKIAKLYRKMRNIRLDYMHKLSWELIQDNQIIATETLQIKKMEQTGKGELPKHIADAGWGMFINMLKYKAELYGRTYVQVDPYFPSSQICRHCGGKNEQVKDGRVEWECKYCEAKILDRDINAAKNILVEGKRILAERASK